jgi:hypothetical protein
VYSVVILFSLPSLENRRTHPYGSSVSVGHNRHFYISGIKERS